MRQTTFGAKWVLVVLAAAVALPSFAGIYGPVLRLDRLTIDGCTHGGSGVWTVSSPTLKALRGYLAYDATGNSREVSFQREKGPGTSWAFAERSRFQDSRNTGKREKGFDIKEVSEGYRMKIQATEGPFQGWYLGRVDGSLVLVKERRKAATLEMLETKQEVGNK